VLGINKLATTVVNAEQCQHNQPPNMTIIYEGLGVCNPTPVPTRRKKYLRKTREQPRDAETKKTHLALTLTV